MSIACLQPKKNSNQKVVSNNRNGIKHLFSEENVEKLQSIMYPMQTKSVGQQLFVEGDKATKLYYIQSGRVKMKKATEDGKELLLSIVSAGDLLGDYGGFESAYHNYSAEVMQDTEIRIIQIKDLEVILFQHGHFAVEFSKWLGLQNQKQQSRFRDLLLFGKTGALASTLIRMSNSYGVMCADGIRIDMKLTNTELAEFIGITRESVNRMLNAWKEEGMIDVKKGHIIIKSLVDLRSICQCPTHATCPVAICQI